MRPQRVSCGIHAETGEIAGVQASFNEAAACQLRNQRNDE